MLDRFFFATWYENYGRAFSWRDPGVSPFALLITEMLLRQTQAVSVSKIWEDIIRQYPNAHSLAGADRNSLIDRIKILGFGDQRSGALTSAAQWLVDYHNGQVPEDLDALLQIPHVGNYSARAVLCFAFNHDIEIVDTNILRFFSRYYHLEVKPDIRRNPEIWELASRSLPKGKAQEHNYGILDFTAEICKSRKPACLACPLNGSCEWYIKLQEDS